MGCNGNYAISHNQNGLSFEDNIFLHLNDAIERIGIHKQMPQVLNVSLITPKGSSFPVVFPYF